MSPPLLRTAAWMVPALAAALAPAYADAVRLSARQTEDGAQIEARWADGRSGDPPAVEAQVEAGVLRLRFAEAVEVEAGDLAAAAPMIVSFAEADGRDVRIALRRPLEAHVGRAGGARVVQLAEPGAPARLSPAMQEAAPAPPPAPSNAASVSVGLRDDFTRLSFRWPETTTVQPRRNGDRLELVFNRAADLDLSELRAAPPRFVRAIELTSRPGQPVRVTLTLEPGVRQRHFVDGPYTVVDLLAPNAESLQASAQAQTQQTAAAADAFRPPRAPSSVRVSEEGQATRIAVAFPTPARAAAFRRGGSIWLLFESGGRFDLSGVARAGRRHDDIIAISGQGLIGLRIPAPPEVQVSARADGTQWIFTLSARREASGEAVTVRRDLARGDRGRIVAEFGRSGVVKWIDDPELGDRFAAALIAGPALAVAQRRATLEAALLPTAQGALIEARADDVAAAFEDGALVVSRGDGLIAAQPAAGEGAAAEVAPAGEAESALPRFTAEARRELDALQRAAAAEGTQEDASVEARLALARALVRYELAAEALGALRVAAINQPELEIDPEFRLLRASANLMMGRVRDARADLDASSLADNPVAALWRGYAAALDEQWEEARAQFERGRAGFDEVADAWRARMMRARAEAALQLGDVPSADEFVAEAASAAATVDARLRAELLRARVIAAKGDQEGALAAFTELTRARDEEVAVRAGLEALRLRRARGEAQAAEAVELLEALRFRWRGDALEIDVIAALGEAYSELGRWREALEVMQVASNLDPESAAARRLRADMSAAFERLFLDGEADALEPIQALGLFYQFVDLTPVGPNGDRMVRLLAGRLVKVDLLEQAAQLLQHQVDERVDGLARAQVAADLAAIYLMDRKPDRAFQAISLTRAPNMPAALLSERRVIEARSLLDMGRADNALELVERDQSADAQRVRAEAAWRSRNWERASTELRRLVEMLPRGAALDADGRAIVLRAAIAMTLAGQDDAVRAFYRAHAGDMAGTPEADAFEVVASDIHGEGTAVRDLAGAVSRTDLLDRFLQRMRARLTEGAGEAAPARAAAAPARAASAPARAPAG